jgi:hypothetical protein
MATGCIPIPTTLGHGASVLSHGERDARIYLGGGFMYYLDRPDESIPYLAVSNLRVGLGGGLQSEVAAAVPNFYPSLTWQIAGERRNSPTQGFALALNAGGSIDIEVGYSTFVGAIASHPFRERTWYVAYRRHYADYYDENWLASECVQDIVFLGVEWSPRISMELFFTWTAEHDNDHPNLPADGIGFNFFVGEN